MKTLSHDQRLNAAVLALSELYEQQAGPPVEKLAHEHAYAMSLARDVLCYERDHNNPHCKNLCDCRQRMVLSPF